LKNRAKSGIYQIDKIRVCAEEIESLGKSDRRELRSQIRRILRRFFKLDTSPAAGWRTTIRDACVEIEYVLRDGPRLRRQVEDFVSEEPGVAAKSAAADFKQHGDAVRVRFDKGGFTAEQVLGGWFPEAADGAPHAAHR